MESLADTIRSDEDSLSSVESLSTIDKIIDKYSTPTASPKSSSRSPKKQSVTSSILSSTPMDSGSQLPFQLGPTPVERDEQTSYSTSPLIFMTLVQDGYWFLMIQETGSVSFTIDIQAHQAIVYWIMQRLFIL